VSRSAIAADRPKQRSRRVRNLLGVAMLPLVGILGTTACGAGQIVQSAHQRSAVDGTRGSIGEVEVQNATVVAPKADFWEKGSEIQLDLTIVNRSLVPDELESVTYGGAEAVLASTGTPADGSAAATAAAPTSSAAPSTSAAPVSAPFTLPAQSAFDVPRDGTITIDKTTQDLYPSASIELEFTFKNAGTLTMEVPVGVPQEEESAGPAYDFHGEEADVSEGGAGGGEGGGEGGSEGTGG